MIGLNDRFLEIQGLPLHPLVVHLAVVLVPLSALTMLVAVAVPKWRRPLQWVALAGLIVGAVATYVAQLSGDALVAAVGFPVEHVRWGDRMLPVVAGLLAVSGLWIWLSHLERWRALRIANAVLTVILVFASLAVTYAAGHTGAEAVWGGVLS